MNKSSQIWIRLALRMWNGNKILLTKLYQFLFSVKVIFHLLRFSRARMKNTVKWRNKTHTHISTFFEEKLTLESRNLDQPINEPNKVMPCCTIRNLQMKTSCWTYFPGTLNMTEEVNKERTDLKLESDMVTWNWKLTSLENMSCYQSSDLYNAT